MCGCTEHRSSSSTVTSTRIPHTSPVDLGVSKPSLRPQHGRNPPIPDLLCEGEYLPLVHPSELRVHLEIFLIQRLWRDTEPRGWAQNSAGLSLSLSRGTPTLGRTGTFQAVCWNSGSVLRPRFVPLPGVTLGWGTTTLTLSPKHPLWPWLCQHLPAPHLPHLQARVEQTTQQGMLHLLHHLCSCLLGVVLRHHGGQTVHVQRVLPVGRTAP